MLRAVPLLAVMAAVSVSAEAAETTVAAAQLPAIEVLGTTPLPGLGLDRAQIPAPVQSATDADIQRSQALDLSDFLNRRFGSVHVNEMQGNPFQPDINYRGYTASPLLGTPQGLSLYLDGVRLNQPFGDVVSWDLIPKAAIASVSLMPGSNPLFGLNTLGGALSIQTKDGRSHPGAALQGYLGGNSRRAAEFEYGGFNESMDWYLTGNLFREDGWREDSPSRVGQIFGKLGWRAAATDLRLTFAYADTSLNGSGLQEQRFLARDYASVYTKPDVTEHESTFVNLVGTHSVNDRLMLSGNAYYRRIRTGTLNGDINEDTLDQAVYQPNAAERAALTAAGFTGFPVAGESAANTPFPFWRCIANVLLRDEPAEKCNGLINRSSTTQENYGLSGQFTLLGTPGGQRNQLTAGAAYDESRVRFRQTSQLGFLNADRSVTGLNAFADGVTGGEIDGQPFDTRVDLDGRIRTWSVYATDTLTLGNVWHVTLSGRYNRTTIRNADQINPGGGPGSLDGVYVYERLNPAAGLVYAPGKALAAYVGYSEGSRAPTAIELGCADPANPCRLPNSMAGDPPLEQVVTKTWELGLHGTLANGARWNAGVFRAENHDDILFVAAPNQSQFGFFKNFGKTRREGFEAGLSGRVGALSLGANYTFLDATYQSAESVNGSSNSTNSTAAAGVRGLDGNIVVRPGDRIPLIPRHMFKAYADYRASDAFSLGLNFIAIGSSYARGNENNLHQPDGVFYLGPGKSGGYGVVNLNAQYRVEPRFSVFGQVNNLFDREYYTASLLGPTGFTGNGSFIARPLPAVGGEFPVQHATFYAPGAPRTFWVGLRYQFGASR
ncbi:MAG TPA: TonB-dependent receptor [Burkholderiales bacterium]|nr:TonB-dependent receptor [Burkholderiales bacterium]